ncbi:hypothetical protein JS533_012220, partial [Bifidobacterium amazonense]|nr:hypothetical protein [Bifidobacterium amazonense]
HQALFGCCFSWSLNILPRKRFSLTPSTTQQRTHTHENSNSAIYVLSDRYDLGEFVIPDDGKIALTLPTNISGGEHHLVALVKDGLLWNKLTVPSSTATVDKTVLNATIKKAEGEKQADYTADTWKPFAEALEAAKKTAANDKATQDEVEAAAAALAKAQAGLKKAETTKPADKTALNAAIKDAEGKKQADYTADSWKPFAEALAAAQKVAADDKAAQADVDAAAKALTEAQAGLKEKDDTPTPPAKVDKTELDKAIKEAETKNEADYTADSWKPFAEALKAAKEVSADEKASQKDVDAAAKALTDAQSTLVKKQPTQPDQPDTPDTPSTPNSGNQNTTNTNAIPVYRLYNKQTRLHLYTADTHEKDVLTSKHGWTDEGVAFKVSKKVAGAKPVYRLYNPQSRRHLITLDDHERSELSTKHGWTDEGIVWYQSDDGTVPVYRMYSPVSGEHLYTADINEYRLNATRDWNQEGLAWMGLH